MFWFIALGAMAFSACAVAFLAFSGVRDGFIFIPASGMIVAAAAIFLHQLLARYMENSSPRSGGALAVLFAACVIGCCVILGTAAGIILASLQPSEVGDHSDSDVLTVMLGAIVGALLGPFAAGWIIQELPCQND